MPVDPVSNYDDNRGFDMGLWWQAELADISTTDHEFSAGTVGLRIFASAAGDIVLRLQGDEANNVTITVGTGVEYIPFRVTHIIRTGTTATAQILGKIR